MGISEERGLLGWFREGSRALPVCFEGDAGVACWQAGRGRGRAHPPALTLPPPLCPHLGQCIKACQPALWISS